MADTPSRPHDSSDVFPVDGGALARARERTHWHGCWADPRHHECAAAEIGRLRAALNALYCAVTATGCGCLMAGPLCAACVRRQREAEAEAAAVLESAGGVRYDDIEPTPVRAFAQGAVAAHGEWIAAAESGRPFDVWYRRYRVSEALPEPGKLTCGGGLAMKCVLKSGGGAFVHKDGDGWTDDIESAMVFDVFVRPDGDGVCVGVDIAPRVPGGFYDLTIAPVKMTPVEL